ncbi:MAG: YggS family pyridoxal phosphate-dependent enzyme [Candidatus Eisenbacteria bacterium]
MSIAASLQQLEAEISLAVTTAGRSREEVTLIAVSKTFPADAIREAHGVGLRDFGENRVQELLQKARDLSDLEFRWHLIGSLQTNKVAAVLPHLGLLHSLDRRGLVEEIARRTLRPLDALIQVKTTDEPTKSGADPSEVAALVDQAAATGVIRLRGFMTIGPLAGSESETRACFRALREIRDREQSRRPDLDLSALSMGMSSDFAWAIEEGATHIRVGTRLFGRREVAH